MLKREADREALTVLEEAARTVQDFENVTKKWDTLDANRERKERYWENLREAALLDWNTNDGTIIPQPFNHPFWRQLLGGDFNDYIHDCPNEVHEFTSSRPVIAFTEMLDANHKELLYYWAIRQWSPQRIAALRGQTDRNIRKVYNKMIENIRLKISERLYPRYALYESLTLAQIALVEACIVKYGIGEIRKKQEVGK